MKPRYRVTLTEDERIFLEGLTKRGKHSARKTINARALLLCDAGPQGPGWELSDIVATLGISERALIYLKKRFVEKGLTTALERKERETPPREVKFDGAFEARLMALACSESPEGYQRWTIRLLAEKVVELEIAQQISPSSVQRVLKKMNLNLICGNTGKFLQKEMLHP
jgi:transposase